MKRVIVTGGTGFLGRNMIRYLCNHSYEVYAIIRPESKNRAFLPQHDHVIPVLCSLHELMDTPELAGKSYDAFYHFAWAGVNRDEIDDDSIQRHSREVSLKAVEAAIALKCSCFIFSGSRSEYGLPSEGFREDTDCHPLVAYGHEKLAFGRQARELCRGTDTQYIHARIFSVYGADDHPWSLIHTAVTKMLNNEPMNLSSCTQRWNFMDVRDMADLLLTFQRQRDAISPEDNRIFNVATDDIRPLREFVEEIYRITDSTSELRFGTFHQAAESAMSLLPDMNKVKRTFGWKSQIAFSEGIRNVIKAVEGNET